MATVSVLAAGHELIGLPVLAKNNFGDTESGGVAGPLGLVVIILLAIATVLLIRNMNRRIRRLPERFGPASQPDAGDPEHPGPERVDGGPAPSTRAGRNSAAPPQESDKGVPLADVSRQDRSRQDHADQGEAVGDQDGESRMRATGRND